MRTFQLNSDEEYEKAYVRKGALIYDFKEEGPNCDSFDAEIYGPVDGRFYRYDDPLKSEYRLRYEWTEYDEDGDLIDSGNVIGWCQEEDCTRNYTEDQLLEAFKDDITAKNHIRSKKEIERILSDQSYIKAIIQGLAPNSQKIEDKVIQKIINNKEEISKSICEELGIKEKHRRHH